MLAGNENVRIQKLAAKQEKALKAKLSAVRRPYKVVVIGAASRLASFIIPSLVNGSIFGRIVKVSARTPVVNSVFLNLSW